jgi:hypothetical protein
MRRVAAVEPLWAEAPEELLINTYLKNKTAKIYFETVN